MVASFARQASCMAAPLMRVLAWPARVGAARRTMAELARMSDYELRDIGLIRQDLNDATSLPLDDDPSRLFVRRRASRSGPRRGERSRGLARRAREKRELVFCK